MTPTLIALSLLIAPATTGGAPRVDEARGVSVSAVAWRAGLGAGLALIASSGFVGQQLGRVAHEVSPGLVGENPAPFIVGVAAAGFAIGAASALAGVRVEADH